MFKDKKVLLIEDFEDDVNLFKVALEENNYAPELEVISDGMNAMNYFQNCIHDSGSKFLVFFDLIFLDINLPLINGFEILEYLQLNNFLDKQNLIVFTGSNADRDIAKCEEFGFNKFYTKPNKISDYISTLESCFKETFA